MKSKYLLLIFSFLFISCKIADYEGAQNGILNYPDKELKEYQFNCLSGKWDFYPGQILNATDIATNNIAPTSIRVPGRWAGLDMERDSDLGFFYGTYHLTVLNDEEFSGSYSIKINGNRSAFLLYVNGQRVLKYGEFNMSTGEFAPGFHDQFAFFDLETNRVDIVIQMAGRCVLSSGLKGRVAFGGESAAVHRIKKLELMDYIFFFILFLFGAYHLALYILRREEPQFLYFALFTMILAIRHALVSYSMIGSHLLSSPYLYDNLQLSLFLLSIPFFIKFYNKAFPRSRRIMGVMKVTFVMMLLLILATWLTPFYINVIIGTISDVTIGIFILFTLFSLKKDVMSKGWIKKKDGMMMLVMGFTFLGFSFLLDIIARAFSTEQLFFGEWGLVLFVVFQALFLARRSVSAFQNVEKLTAKLRKQNEELEDRVEERTAELKQAYDEIEATLDEVKRYRDQVIVQEKLASLGALTAGIAHEIKNPLNFVNNFSSLSIELIDELKGVLDSEKDKLSGNAWSEMESLVEDIIQNLEKVVDHGKRADNIVRSMLEHSREGNREKREENINTLLDEYVKMAYHGMRARDSSFNVTLKTDFDEKTGQISIVAADISRVILNILNNAFYAVHEKAQRDKDFDPVVEVRSEDAGSHVAIIVRDNGDGIPDSIRDNIFQPFFTTKPTGKGNTGLGLSISYDIVTQEHGGQIKVDSKPGEYCEFRVELPR